MPFRAKAPCSYPGCNVLTREGRCPVHPYRNDRHRTSAASRGYDSDWTRLRNAYIRAHPICEIRQKCSGAAAVEVDHILALANGGERLDETNLQSTCKACHSWKTAVVDAAQAARKGRG